MFVTHTHTHTHTHTPHNGLPTEDSNTCTESLSLRELTNEWLLSFTHAASMRHFSEVFFTRTICNKTVITMSCLRVTVTVLFIIVVIKTSAKEGGR